MKIGSNCSGECCVCRCGDFCLAGHGDDDFCLASKETIIERLDNNKYKGYRQYMINFLQKMYGYDYEERKESEDNTMLHKVTVTKTEEKALEEYWCMRAIKENPETKSKSVVKESECNQEPTLEEIALFLANSGGDFVSVEHNYRFADLPF